MYNCTAAWGAWGEWSPCDSSYTSRERICPMSGRCSGDSSERDPCANGGFGSWESWNPCSPDDRTRTRQCNNPAPSVQGLDCVGDTQESESCTHGQWSTWSEWTLCDGVTIMRTQTRTCDNPEPANGGSSCDGDALQESNCPTWSEWSNPSDCDARADGSFTVLRTRTCLHQEAGKT